jgi:hypothetical protein
MSGEAGSAPAEAAEKYKAWFREHLVKDYDREAVFNADEAGLFWKKMPSRTYITKRMDHVPGRKLMKDRVTVLLCANASGTLPIPLLLIHKSANPRAFKGTDLVFILI